MSSNGVDVLRERILNAIDYATEECELTYVEVAGMLSLILSDVHQRARETEDDDRWCEDK